MAPSTSADVATHILSRSQMSGRSSCVAVAWFSAGSCRDGVPVQGLVGLTPEVGGSARPNHGLTTVVTVARLTCSQDLVSPAISNARNWLSPTKSYVIILDGKLKSGATQKPVFPGFSRPAELTLDHQYGQNPHLSLDFQALLMAGDTRDADHGLATVVTVADSRAPRIQR